MGFAGDLIILSWICLIDLPAAWPLLNDDLETMSRQFPVSAVDSSVRAIGYGVKAGMGSAMAVRSMQAQPALLAGIFLHDRAIGFGETFI